MELFVTLVSRFQPLTNATKNSTLGFLWILNEPLISDVFVIENLIWILKLKYPAIQIQFPVNMHSKDLFIATVEVMQIILSSYNIQN